MHHQFIMIFASFPVGETQFDTRKSMNNSTNQDQVWVFFPQLSISTSKDIGPWKTLSAIRDIDDFWIRYSDISLKTAIFCFINGDILPQKWRYSDIHTHIGDILRVPTWNFDITDFENPIFDTDPPLPGLYLIHRRIEQSTRFRRLIKVSPTNEVKTGNRS